MNEYVGIRELAKRLDTKPKEIKQFIYDKGILVKHNIKGDIINDNSPYRDAVKKDMYVKFNGMHTVLKKTHYKYDFNTIHKLYYS